MTTRPPDFLGIFLKTLAVVSLGGGLLLAMAGREANDRPRPYLFGAAETGLHAQRPSMKSVSDITMRETMKLNREGF